jgi:hypothetical protein
MAETELLPQCLQLEQEPAKTLFAPKVRLSANIVNKMVRFMSLTPFLVSEALRGSSPVYARTRVENGHVPGVSKQPRTFANGISCPNGFAARFRCRRER